jgi:hypothetical protein
MIPNLSLKTSGLLDPRVLDAWTREKRAKVRRGVVRAMREEGPRVSAAVNSQVRQSFTTQSRGFANQFKARIYDSKPDRLPMMLVRSRVPWMGLYTRGGTIRGPLLIPLNQAKRMRTDHFRRVVQQLIASGMTERAAAAKVLEEIGDKEAPPAIETGALREVIAELTRVLDGLAEVKMRCRESEAHIAELRATASSLADRIADIEARVSAIERPWWHRWRPALTERAQ